MSYMGGNRKEFGWFRAVVLLMAVTVLLCTGAACAESAALPETVKLAYGESCALPLEDLPAETVWSSDHPEIVSVDANGVLTAHRFGTANVTGSIGGEIAYSVKVVVVVPDHSVSVEDGEIVDAQQPEEEEGLISAAAATTVAQKVEQLAQQCIASGAKGDFEIALWMHDWLVYNANYDYTYTQYGPEGVLLKGTGVCQSYAMAYELLMDRMGIENILLISWDMNHSWNLIKMEGEWYHVDCTWDDPGTGGNENHTYFGLNDRLMGRDHIWINSDYPACNSLACYYPIRTGQNCAESEEAAEKLLIELLEERTTKFDMNYVGDEAGFSLWTFARSWIVANGKSYGVSNLSMSGNTKRISATVSYSAYAKKQGVHLSTPVKAPDFALESLNGRYKLSNYSKNGLALIFGEQDCSDTLNLLDNMTGKVDALAAKGVEVLVSISGAADPVDLIEITQACPGLNYVCWQDSLLEKYLSAVGASTTAGKTPAMFVINSAGKITYYSLGYVSNKKEVTDEAYAVGTGKALPQPEANEYSQGLAGTGNITGLTGDEAAQLQALATENELLLYVMDSTLGTDMQSVMAEYEKNFDLYDRLNIRMVVSVAGRTADTQAYPNVEFIPYNSSLFWKLLYTAGFKTTQTSYSRSQFLIDSDGSIVSYANGYDDLPDPWNAAVDMVQDMQCNLRMPAAMRSVEESAFECAAFGSVDLTCAQITEIGDRAFADCMGLELIKIPDCVETIAASAFEGSGNVVIFCSAGSAAHAYAEENDILCLTK